MLSTATDKLAANEMAWSVGMVIGGALLATVARTYPAYGNAGRPSPLNSEAGPQLRHA